VRDSVLDLRARTLDQSAFADQFSGRGLITAQQVEAFGLSGAVARASGVDLDLRRDRPYLMYDAVADSLDVPLGVQGDALARVAVLMDQVVATADLVDALVAHPAARAAGPVDVRLPKVLRVPEGTTSLAVEAPGGISGYVLVSRGDRVPWRLGLRTPSFSTASLLPDLLVGSTVQDVVTVLQSLQLVIGDLDK
jgi:NADH-quinone oxidoreductase subunit D